MSSGETQPVGDHEDNYFGEFLEQYRKSCAGLHIDYRLTRTDQSVESFIRAYLQERRRLSK